VRTRVTALAVVPLLLMATACGSDDDGGGDGGEQTGSLEGVEVTGEFNETPEIAVDGLKATENDSAVLIEGDGPEADKEGQSLVNIAIVSGVDGTNLFSTWDNGQPTTVGAGGQLNLKGLDVAMDGAPRGSRVAFKTSAEDVLGADGLSQYGLEADDAVVAVADILSVQDLDALEAPEGETVTPPAGAPALVEKDGVVTNFDWTGVGAKPGKVQVIPLIEGDGPAIEKNRLVTFDYFGEVFKGDKPFDESFSKEPVTFMVGAGGLIPAWDESLIGVKEGSRVLIIAPPDKAYGAQANGDIPANSTLAFVIDVLGVDG
jgi:peptidylprolyl isomerase